MKGGTELSSSSSLVNAVPFVQNIIKQIKFNSGFIASPSYGHTYLQSCKSYTTNEYTCVPRLYWPRKVIRNNSCCAFTKSIGTLVSETSLKNGLVSQSALNENGCLGSGLTTNFY